MGKQTQALYKSRWRRLRQAVLDKRPLCVMCLQDGRITPATVVDHIIPHRGNPALMWDEANLQPLCATHHNATKQRLEKGSRAMGCDANGMPLDQEHGWVAERKGGGPEKY